MFTSASRLSRFDSCRSASGFAAVATPSLRHHPERHEPRQCAGCCAAHSRAVTQLVRGQTRVCRFESCRPDVTH